MTSIPLPVAILAAAVTIVAGSIGLYLIIKKKSLVFPKMHIDFGLSRHLRMQLPRKLRKTPVTLIAIGVPKARYENEVVCGVICAIENSSPHPLKNVTLQFEYPSDFKPPSQEEMKARFSDKVVVKDHEPPTRISGYLATRIDVGTLRPGEPRSFAPPLRLKPFGIDVERNGEISKHAQMLSELLREDAPLAGVCPVRLFVLCEELPRSESNVLIVWISAEDMDQLKERVVDLVKRLWTKATGKLGLFKYPWERLHYDGLVVFYFPRYFSSSKSGHRLMDLDLKMDQLDVGTVRMPYNRPYGDLHKFQ